MRLSRGLSFLAQNLPSLIFPRLSLPLAFAALALAQSSDTFRLPNDWRHLPAASSTLQGALPSQALVVAPEALLYHAGLRGARLEVQPAAARRAAGEWHHSLPPDVEPALALVELYRQHGHRYLADLPAAASDAPRLALHHRLALRYTILQDGPSLFLLDLQRPALAEAAAHVASKR